MSEHTPGPHMLVPPGGPQGPFWGLLSPSRHVVATQIVGEADARLFAQAPELLAALEELRGSEGWERCDDSHCEICQKRERCEAVIAAARGIEDR